MELIEELKILENTYHNEEDLLITKNSSSVLLINLSNDLINNTYLKALTRYVAANTSSSYIVNTKESVILNEIEINNIIKEMIDEQEIKLIINIKSTQEDFDIIYKTSTNLDYTTIKELEDAFHESLITNIKEHEHKEENINYDYIELLINDSYHNLEDQDKLEKLSQALINFIKMYSNFSD
jgi:hypothetical protein